MATETRTARGGDCMACRGSGQVISNLGGEASSVTCPWCDGSGLALAGHDAQTRWKDGQEGRPDAVDDVRAA